MTTCTSRIRRAAATIVMVVAMVGVSSVAWADVWLYSDSWNADDADASGDIELFAWGAGDSDDRPFTLTLTLKDPNQNVLAGGSASGWGYKELTRSAILTSGAPSGEYKNIVQADQGPEHYGCVVFAIGIFEIFAGAYGSAEAPPAEATSWDYDRCTTGDCQEITVKKTHFVSQPAQMPQNAWVSVWVFDYFFDQVCRPYGAAVKVTTCS